jgi:ribosomal protein S12
VIFLVYVRACEVGEGSIEKTMLIEGGGLVRGKQVRFKVVKVSGVGLLALWKEKKVSCDDCPDRETGHH